MAGMQPVRGTHDLLPEDSVRHRHVEATAFAIANRYGYGEIVTPIFEFTEVFTRTLGDTSDIVTKEMYTFTDKGGESITLRPEGTAGVARAFISGGLAQHLPLKLFYRGPMFRYERPQKGRLRQFHQVGIEYLGSDSPLADVEVIATGYRFLEALGLADKITLELNSLGDAESRAAYREVLVRYLTGHLDRLSQDSKARLERNPMRVLDSKDDDDRAVIAQAPLLGDHLNEASRAFFAELQAGLTALGIPFAVSPRLVRGLDYYCHTAFEFTTSHLGSQGTVLAGGRYDGLIAEMGGPRTPGIGWAAGVERLSMLAGDKAPALARPIVVVPAGTYPVLEAFKLADALRQAGHSVDCPPTGSMKNRLKRADKLGAKLAVIIGDEEQALGEAMVKDLDSGHQERVPMADLPRRLAPRG
ncbi:MAG: histidine--tRNA ligase [Rhodospirillales bacterium]|nr:histidine--tRNA ligase [Rhodospirillales bacterium]